MEFVIGALTMLFGVLAGAAILSTVMARSLPSKNDTVTYTGSLGPSGNVTVLPTTYTYPEEDNK